LAKHAFSVAMPNHFVGRFYDALSVRSPMAQLRKPGQRGHAITMLALCDALSGQRFGACLDALQIPQE
jgi:hypothetical protein